ncbi:hypothetical protein [Acidithiobacillus sp.]|uniref:hypothetical protein n=1 Tax=Acidithiobacillus sp. TaxID=1872118 RepID=UPI0025C53CE7|nr:hypothetical protein [Acidithiobacillus sp.]MCK9188756.1 hypothetical protein [Acidithiobacillus sp.]MCK9359702.1 hypothetical protein [Acidithiobacillus sp.]
MVSGTEKIDGARRSIDIIGVATTEREIPLSLHRQQTAQKECIQLVQVLEHSNRGFQGNKILRSKV